MIASGQLNIGTGWRAALQWTGTRSLVALTEDNVNLPLERLRSRQQVNWFERRPADRNRCLPMLAEEVRMNTSPSMCSYEHNLPVTAR